MATTAHGYSGTPLPRKLGIKPGSVVVLLHAPVGFEGVLGELPDGARLRHGARGAGDVVLLFAGSRSALERGFPAARRVLAPGGRLWIAWPKKASGVATDVAEGDVRAHGLARGIVDYKVCAIDAVWSGLCFAVRSDG